MTLETFWMWVVVGLIAGWAAGYVLKDGGYGLTGDMVLGVMGSILASGLLLLLGVSADSGLVVSVIVPFVGAGAAIFLQHEFWGVSG